MKECDLLYEDIFFLADISEILIKPEDSYLPEKAFIFSSGYQAQFMFFDADSSEPEPSIFYYPIDNEEFKIIR